MKELHVHLEFLCNDTRKNLSYIKIFLAFLEIHKLMLQFDVILKKNGDSLNNWHFFKTAALKLSNLDSIILAT